MPNWQRGAERLPLIFGLGMSPLLHNVAFYSTLLHNRDENALPLRCASRMLVTCKS